ncbi:hypothetical protein O6H91_11G092000 [Diphasiastrum complanatum]|uniref:Uncharacterized protein n=2 Tax=Diphasiastrum complanatum TaxID=34168 RepID=A0ACC2C9M7_DIPCM|nr:hypothetical protein O6H91_11G060200 [Diphasiastrum complanatum]KAJ7539422.1 hypothetical protein O6H91_11G092000 [Diphasiastrum complanatum]
MAATSALSSMVAGSTTAPCMGMASLEALAFRGTPIIHGLPAFRALHRPAGQLRVAASAVKKVKVKEPLGPSGDAKFRGGLDASGRQAKGKGVYQFAKKYGANVDGYSPIYAPEEWSPTGDVYAGGPNGLILWALTLAGILGAGVLLVYNTSALAQ